MQKIALHNKENKYSRYISSLSNTSNVEVFESGDVKFEIIIGEEIYSILFSRLSDQKLPVVFLCNPKEGRTTKPHRLHLQKLRLIHLCLSVREDISVRQYDYKRIIDYSIARITRLLSLSGDEEEREFRKEFLYFWNKASTNFRKVKLFIESSNEVKSLGFFKKKDVILSVDGDIVLNKLYFNGYEKTDFVGYYLPIVNLKGVLPPFDEQPWGVDELNYILNECISESNIEKLETFITDSKKVLLAFEMNLSDTLPIAFLLNLEFRNKKIGNIFERLRDLSRIEHWSSQRCDVDYLFKRIGIKTNQYKKRVMVVGAGSLGSYILAELPKMGVNNITIFDGDNFSVENIMRHRLNGVYEDNNKAFAMGFELQTSFPQLMISYHNENFREDKLSSYDLDKYDLIIVTTGGTDFMLSINREFKVQKLSTPVVFAWIETNGIGVHSLIVDYNKKGCFKCLYTNSDRNKAHFSNESNKYKFIGTGCGSVFNSYGNLTLLKGSAMVLELIQIQLEKIHDLAYNPLYSVRTLSFHSDGKSRLSKRDFETKRDYYIDERCDICGV